MSLLITLRFLLTIVGLICVYFCLPLLSIVVWLRIFLKAGKLSCDLIARDRPS